MVTVKYIGTAHEYRVRDELGRDIIGRGLTPGEVFEVSDRLAKQLSPYQFLIMVDGTPQAFADVEVESVDADAPAPFTDEV